MEDHYRYGLRSTSGSTEKETSSPLKAALKVESQCLTGIGLLSIFRLIRSAENSVLPDSLTAHDFHRPFYRDRHESG